jgi:hypothetical protein
MHFFAALFALLALTAIPTALAATWNDKLKIWDIGHVATVESKTGKYKINPIRYPGLCGGIPKLGYACGSYKEDGMMALRAIYRCENGWLTLYQVCHERDLNDRCVKNERKKGKRFYPAAPGDRIVCAQKEDVIKP